jgi:hypothetical protein
LGRMYDNDTVIFEHGRASTTISLKSGIRQVDPLLPHCFRRSWDRLSCRLFKMEDRRLGRDAGPLDVDSKITVLAYADDITVFAAKTHQAGRMLEDLALALRGINLQLLPQKRNAFW